MEPKDLWEKKLLVFDLDGTLYQDRSHFAVYAREIARRLPEEKREAYLWDYQNSLLGKGPVQFGDFYDAFLDVLFRRDEKGDYRAYSWEGELLPQVKAPEQFRPGEGRHIFVGDDWWVPLVIGRHYGASDSDIGQAFLLTRAFQASPQYELPRNERLVEFLRSFRQGGGYLALMTNSPQPDSEIILEKLGLRGTFDKAIFAAGKPLLTRAHLQSLLQQFRVSPGDAVSIGDNPLNDILPARILGLRTVFIDPYQLAHEADPDLSFPHLDDFLEWVMSEKTAARS